jgi:chemotaxis protein MotB
MGKKGKCPEFENHERWLVSYADMLTLLFAVFVVLYSLKEGGEPQVQQAAGAMQESFNTPLEDIPLDRKYGPSQEGFGIFEHFRGEQILPPLIQKYPSTKQKIGVIDSEKKKVEMELEERLYGPNKYPKGRSDGNERIVDVKLTESGFKLQLMARHFYNSGEYKIRKEALKDFDEVVAIVKGLGRDVTIEGHTDSIPPKGKLTNWELSALRATFAVKYMIKEHLFPQFRIAASGYADTKPIAHNGTEAGRKINRRIEMHIHYDSKNK